MDGFQVAHKVREMFGDGLTVMMLSSDDIKTTLVRTQPAELDAYLIKPVRRVALFEAIAGAMNKRDGAAPEQARVAPTRADLPTADSRPIRILLVDDSRDNRLLVRAFLSNTSAILAEAENGAVAVEMVQSGQYDLILMDIQMPVMDGYEAIRRVRQWEKDCSRARTRILALTASALESDVRRCIEAGADLHLSKPVKKRVLLAALQASQSEATPAAA